MLDASAVASADASVDASVDASSDASEVDAFPKRQRSTFPVLAKLRSGFASHSGWQCVLPLPILIHWKL